MTSRGIARPKLIPLFKYRDEIRSNLRRVVGILTEGLSALMKSLCAAQEGTDGRIGLSICRFVDFLLFLYIYLRSLIIAS